MQPLPHQPCSLHCAEEELGSVSSRASIGHRKNAGSGVLEREILILKLGSVNALASSAIVVGEVSSLYGQNMFAPVIRILA